jgi:hypothetical protein
MIDKTKSIKNIRESFNSAKKGNGTVPAVHICSSIRLRLNLAQLQTDAKIWMRTR